MTARQPIPMPQAADGLRPGRPVPYRCDACRSTTRDLVRDAAGQWRVQLLHQAGCTAATTNAPSRRRVGPGSAARRTGGYLARPSDVAGTTDSPKRKVNR